MLLLKPRDSLAMFSRNSYQNHDVIMRLFPCGRNLCAQVCAQARQLSAQLNALLCDAPVKTIGIVPVQQNANQDCQCWDSNCEDSLCHCSPM